MKILQVINSVEGGGAEKLVVQLHQAYISQGIDSHLLSLMKFSHEEFLNVYSLNSDNCYSCLNILKLYSFLNQPRWKDVDILHVHLFPAQIFVPIVAKLAGIKSPLLTTDHSTFNRRRTNFLGKTFDKYMYSFYTNIVCISNGVYKVMSEWQPRYINKLVVINNGIDLENFSYFNYQSKLEEEKLIVLSVGRLSKEKNYETAIRAISKIRDENFEYWILGGGYLESALKDLVVFLNLENKVKFFGFSTDVSSFLRQSDIFLLTSLWEGFGMAVVEAMAVGIPVIVSNVLGVRELLDEKNQVGYLIDPTSEDEIAERLCELIKNPRIRVFMSRNGRKKAVNYSIKKVVNSYINLYKQIIN